MADQDPVALERQRMEATFAAIVERSTLRALLFGGTRQPIDLSPQERAAALEPLKAAIEADAAACAEVGRQLYLLGAERVHATLHGAPGVDHALLDDAVEFHAGGEGDGSPVAL